jgi:PAS domain S-box-containing protein
MDDRHPETDDPTRLLRRVVALEAENAALRARASPVGGAFADGDDRDFRLLADAFPSLIAYLDAEERYRFVNLAYESWFGMPREAFLGRTAREVVGEEAYARRADRIRAALAGRSVRFEQSMPHRDGGLHHTETLYEPRRGADGTVEGFYVLVIDVTERRAAQDALRERDTRLRDVLESISDAFYAVDQDWRFTYVNRKAEELWRRRREDLVGKVYWEEFPKAVGSEAHEAHLLAARERRPVQLETVSPILGHWVDISIYPGPGGLSVYFRDITRRKRAEDELRRLNAALEGQVAARTAERDRIWTLIPDLLMAGTLDGRFLAVNPAWTRALGHEDATLLARPFRDLVHPDDLPAMDEALARMRAGLDSRHQSRVLTAAGDHRWFDWVGTPSDGVFYAVARDVTEERDRRAELERAQEQLRQAQKMEAVGRLTGGIAHDFNNLLQAIGGSIEAVERRLARGGTEVGPLLRGAREATDRAAALTGRLLAFSRRQPLAPASLDVNALVAGMEDLLRRLVGPAVRLEIRPGEGLWRVRADANQVESALLNLAANARDAMPGGGTLAVSTANLRLDGSRAEPDAAPGDFVTLAVADTGTGMPAEVVDRAFEPFFTTKPVGQGTGLGLSQLYGFARQSGGHVRIESEPGRGTTVLLNLPRAPEEGVAEERAPEALAPPPRAATGPERCRGTVLVVEDEALVRALLAEALEERGCDVLSAADGTEALRILEGPRRVDLLATDLGLPGLDGRRLARAARSLRPDLPVLYLTGYAHDARIEDELGPRTQLLVKPVEVEAFVARATAMMAGR